MVKGGSMNQLLVRVQVEPEEGHRGLLSRLARLLVATVLCLLTLQMAIVSSTGRCGLVAEQTQCVTMDLRPSGTGALLLVLVLLAGVLWARRQPTGRDADLALRRLAGVLVAATVAIILVAQVAFALLPWPADPVAGQVVPVPFGSVLITVN